MKNINIIHSCHGRIRLQLAVIKKNLDAFDHLEKKIKCLSGVLDVRSNLTLSCMILTFDTCKIGQTSILKELDAHLSQWLSQHQPNKPLMTKTARGKTLFQPLLNFLSISVIGAGLLLRPLFTPKAIIQAPSTPLGIITMISALPLLGKLFQDIRNKQISSETILDVSVYASIFAGEIIAAIEILWITHAGILLQAWITERSRHAISSIAQMSESTVITIRDGKETEIPSDQLSVEDIVKFKTGDRLSVDGYIIEGIAEIDESSITGRSEPIEKSKGNQVFSGSFIFQGEITVSAQKIGHQTYLATIFQMVEESLENKADIENMAETLSNKLLKVDLAVTLSTLLFTRDIRRSFSVMLVVACPCATILAASTAISSALYLAARKNVLIKGGRYLEQMKNMNVICFDKTGTLTTREPELTCFKNFSDMEDKDLLRIIYSAQMNSKHPLAIGFKKAAQQYEIEPIDRESYRFFPGKGVHAMIQGNNILIGNQKLLEQFDIHTAHHQHEVDCINQQSLTPVFVSMNNELSAIAGFETLDRNNIASVMDFFRKDGVQKMALITGDSRQTAKAFCKRYKFDDCYDSILPENKADIITSIKQNGQLVLMVGDGINDSLALAEADIGVAMGVGGSEVAIEAADIALANDDLNGLVFVRSLSHETIRIIYQNFWIAVGSDVIGVILGGLGYLSPLMAGSLHIFHTLGILGNSSRILCTLSKRS
jgi:cation-transporting P-type ATPase C